MDIILSQRILYQLTAKEKTLIISLVITIYLMLGILSRMILPRVEFFIVHHHKLLKKLITLLSYILTRSYVLLINLLYMYLILLISWILINLLNLNISMNTLPFSLLILEFIGINISSRILTHIN